MAATCDAVSPAAAVEGEAAAADGAPPAVVRETALKTGGPKWAGKTPGFSLREKKTHKNQLRSREKSHVHSIIEFICNEWN